MKLRDAIYKVDRSASNEGNADPEPFVSMLFADYQGIDWNAFTARVKQYYLAKWLCTDTWVGSSVYYLDNEPIAVSWQPARKSDERIEFISEEAANKMKAFMLTLIEEDNPKPAIMLPSDLDKEITTFKVHYTGQLLDDAGLYNGYKVAVTKRYRNIIDKRIDIRYLEGEFAGKIETIEVDELDIPIHVKED